MPIPNYYETLGVEENASAADIKKHYRRLVRQYHPDRNPDDPQAAERFKQVQEAYDTLGDEEKRRAYDRRRRDPFAGQDFGGFHGGAPGGGRVYRTPDGTYVRVESSGFGPEGGFHFGSEGPDGPGGLGDLFGQFFGGPHEAPPFGGRARREAARGQDVETRLEIPFEQALRGGKTEVRLPEGEAVRISIPEGVEDGERVRLRGQGRPGPGGQRGDLYITFEVRPHPRFRREGRDLVAPLSINLAEAVLGTARTIQNAYGDAIRVTIPAGTQPGERLRLRRQGVRSGEDAGDLYVEVRVHIPVDLPPEALERFRAWAEQAGLLPENT